ncbi:MAG TPA: hypothetical protein VGS07_32330 [Thermoanaerobaculia bacterium]|jgi:hypothetical protein|nr:hypothetical protein [Thermoanaerobaculia bacterium]
MTRPPEPISVWEPREVDGERVFVRPDPLPLGDHFAAVKELRPKKAELPLRVAFFGESVAAGYLYAPHLTPARVLESQLRAAGGETHFEVIDLARTNETLASLAETVRTSLQINPDVLAIFVGNNWNLLETPEVSPYAPSVTARREVAAALRAEGISGPIRLAAERLHERAQATLEQIAFIARTVQIPVVLVLPEVNLADWETRQPPVWLPGDGAARWHGLYKVANHALERRDLAAAREAADSMLELDGGACASTWRILARIQGELGNPEEARRAALAEVDAAGYATLAFLGAPQATTAAREIQGDAARRHGFAAVDLRAVFREHTGEILPGRRMFLDYCHLTTEGIHVAMAAVAAEVLNLSGMLETDVDWQSLLRRLPVPVLSPEAEATARLGAAIHSAHRLLTVGRKGPILEHWLDAALEASPGVEAAMLDVAEARCIPAPAVLTAALRRNFASPYRLLLQHGIRWDFLDADLLEAVQAVLERRGTPARVWIARLLLQHHAMGEEGTDLAEPPYLWEPLERFFPEVMRFEDLAERATVRSPWPATSFCLICNGEKDVRIEPTLRLPTVNGSRSGRVAIEINGVEIGGMDATDLWSRGTLRIGRGHLHPGLNRLTLHWPAPREEGGAALQAAIRRLEQGLAADLHPIFGEVFSLIAHTA